MVSEYAVGHFFDLCGGGKGGLAISVPADRMSADMIGLVEHRAAMVGIMPAEAWYCLRVARADLLCGP